MSFQSQGVDLNFTNGFYQSRSNQQSIATCINYYPVIHQTPTLSPESLYMTSGIQSVLSGLDGICRGFHEAGEIAYAVCGTRLYSITQTVNPDLTITWAANNLGAIPGSSRVIIDSGVTGNSYELVIVDPGVASYHYDVATATLSALDGVSNFLSPAIDVCNVYGFFVFIQEGTNKIFHSNLRDAQTYGALDFFTLTIGQLRGCINYREQLYIFTEFKLIPMNYIGASQGNVGFAFAVQPNAVKPYGLRNVYAKADMGTYLIFLGNRRNAEPAVFMYTGGEPQKISTETVDKKIQSLTNNQLNNAFMLTWSQGGANNFCVIAGDECLVFNTETGRWVEQKSYINEEQRRWRVNAICQAYNVLLVGDFQSGLIGILDVDTTTEYGENIHREVILQPYDNKGRYIQVSAVKMYLDMGFGGHMSMSISDDGYIFNNSIDRQAGAIGEYGKVLEWDRCGTASNFRVLKFSTDTTAQCHINKVIAK